MGVYGKILQGIMLMYFDSKRKRYAIDDLSIIHECAGKAGIREHLFVNFGLLLGIVREQDFIAHDDDIDMCVMAHKISKDQESNYVEYLKEKGMCAARWKSNTRSDTGRHTWFGIRRQHDHCKFCHWFMFPWNGYFWHSKGGLWVTNRKFNKENWKYKDTDNAIMKGIPLEYLDELIDVDFRGLKIKIPKRFGSCLDFMYPGWRIPRKGGASSKTIIAIVPQWDNQRTWKIQHSH